MGGTQTAAGALPLRLPAPRFPAELPITARIDEIVALLRAERVLVVVGETGSGKTTQLPKACLAAGLGRRGVIAHTQPRRLAARAVSARIAEELGVTLGAEVGYAVRFDDRAGAATRVRVLTDGLLLAELQRDPRLRRYECVIVDEAHERSLNVDFLLGGLKRLLDQRADLKVVITSATIDATAFATHFGDAPVVEVSGRGHPVEIVYRPREAASRKDASEPDHERALVECLEHIAKAAPASRRDVLVFQSGEREIFDSARLLKRRFAARFDILPLYARLPPAEQARVFAPSGRQRVVLATNIAETSLTVPNIGYVVDPGFARISRYSYRAKLQRLPVEPISQASAAQRAGRCGRVGPGVCYRLYSEEDLQARPAYTPPEIQRTNLAAVVLAMRAWRLGDVETFPFLEPPARRAVADAVRLLRELQALDGDELTDIGRAMARLPVDSRLARMLVAASRTGALAEMLVVVSVLAAQDPRLRPLDRQAAADQAHAEFEAKNAGGAGGRPADGDKRSDFLTFLRLWRWLEDARAEHTRAGFRRALEKRFLSPARVGEWRALHRQLLLACRRLGWKTNQQPADYATLHQALLTGSLGFVGAKREPGEEAPRRGRKRAQAVEYDGPRGLRFRLFPGSALRRASPKWVLAAQISDTGNTFARCVAAVEPRWIEQAAAHIAKRSYSEPRWDAQRGEAVVLESVSVYGLVVASGRRRRAAEVVPDAARELFALEALVRPDARIDAPFLARNQRLIDAVLERQGKRRRMDLLASEPARADFYLARLPAEVCSLATWRQFAANATAAQLARFEMREADVLRSDPGASDDDFPPVLTIADGEAPLAYKFAPGAADDGVTVRVDWAALAQLDLDAVEWLVPGFLEEKCLALGAPAAEAAAPAVGAGAGSRSGTDAEFVRRVSTRVAGDGAVGRGARMLGRGHRPRRVAHGRRGTAFAVERGRVRAQRCCAGPCVGSRTRRGGAAGARRSDGGNQRAGHGAYGLGAARHHRVSRRRVAGVGGGGRRRRPRHRLSVAGGSRRLRGSARARQPGRPRCVAPGRLHAPGAARASGRRPPPAPRRRAGRRIATRLRAARARRQAGGDAARNRRLARLLRRPRTTPHPAGVRGASGGNAARPGVPRDAGTRPCGARQAIGGKRRS